MKSNVLMCSYSHFDCNACSMRSQQFYPLADLVPRILRMGPPRV